MKTLVIGFIAAIAILCYSAGYAIGMKQAQDIYLPEIKEVGKKAQELSQQHIADMKDLTDYCVEKIRIAASK